MRAKHYLSPEIFYFYKRRKVTKKGEQLKLKKAAKDSGPIIF